MLPKIIGLLLPQKSYIIDVSYIGSIGCILSEFFTNMSDHPDGGGWVNVRHEVQWIVCQ
jgi:hypothetical protein